MSEVRIIPRPASNSVMPVLPKQAESELMLATRISRLTFIEERTSFERLRHAQKIAAKYKFDPPEIVLMFTHPEVRLLPLSERCKKVGITEEEYVAVAFTSEFKKFLKDWREAMNVSLEAQTYAKLGQAVERDRSRYDKNGNEIEDHGVELEVYKAARQAEVPRGSSSALNVSFNMFDEARARAKSLVQVQPAGEVFEVDAGVEMDDDDSARE